MLIPRVKKFTAGNTALSGEGIRIRIEGDMDGKTKAAISLLIQNKSVSFVREGEDANVVFCRTEPLEHSEEYEIRAENGTVTVIYGDFLGGRNGAAALSQLLIFDGDSVVVTASLVRDYPDAQFRSFMTDVGRKYIPMDEMKMHIWLMARCRMNYLHFHLAEAQGFGIALKGHPELRGAAATDGKQYTEEEIAEIVDYAEALGIEVIPEIDIPGHGRELTRAYPQLACLPEDGTPSYGWALCLGTEETYEIAEKLIRAVCKLFRSQYMHIGTDEITNNDLRSRMPYPISDWTRCKRCRPLMKSYDLAGEVELFYGFLRRMHALITSLGKRMVMWNDWIDISVSPDLPRDILIQFWRVAAKDRGPYVGCSMQRFLDEGFDVINSNYPDTYIDLYMTYDRVTRWNYRRFPANDEGTKGRIIGGDMCAWDVHKHFVWSVPVSIPVFAERLWNSEKPADEDLPRDISNLLLGDDGFNVFDYTKDVLGADPELDIFREDADISDLAAKLGELKPTDAVSEHCLRALGNLCKEKLENA